VNDFPGTTRAKIDADRASNLGDALGQLAFGMKETQYKAQDVEKLMVGDLPEAG
jgi:hypothetical protein